MKFSDNLNEFDILDLLNEYHSELRKLKHKTGFVKDRITELEALYEKKLKRNEKSRVQSFTEHIVDDADNDQESGTDIQKHRKHPLKDKKLTAPKRTKKNPKKKRPQLKATERQKPGRKQQALSLWDQMIVDSITEHGRPTISREILDDITKRATEQGIYDGEEKTKSKLNQCLVKLTSDNRKTLIKIPFEGRGHAYALAEWANAKD